MDYVYLKNCNGGDGYNHDNIIILSFAGGRGKKDQASTEARRKQREIEEKS